MVLRDTLYQTPKSLISCLQTYASSFQRCASVHGNRGRGGGRVVRRRIFNKRKIAVIRPIGQEQLKGLGKCVLYLKCESGSLTDIALQQQTEPISALFSKIRGLET